MPELILLEAYDIASDPDLNTFTTGDMEDIAQSGIGHAMQQSASMIGFVVFIVIIVALFGMFAFALSRMRKGRR